MRELTVSIALMFAVQACASFWFLVWFMRQTAAQSVVIRGMATELAQRENRLVSVVNQLLRDKKKRTRG